METKKFFALAIAATVWIAPLLAAEHEGEAPRAVVITIKAQEPDGDAIAGAPITLRSSIQLAYGVTDASGVLQIQAILGHAAETLTAVINIRPQTRPGPEMDAEIKTINSYAFQPIYELRVEEGQAEAELKIIAPPAIIVSGRLVNDDGLPVQGLVIVVGAMHRAKSQENDGRFHVGGVAVAQNGRLAVLTDGGPCALVRLVNPMADSDLGDIVVPSLQEASTVRVRTVYGAESDTRLWNTVAGVTLVSADGGRILTFLISPESNGVAVKNYSTGELPKVPIGEYYVAPGLFSGAPWQVRLIESLREGKRIDDRVPKLTVTADADASLDVRSKQAIDAILSPTAP